MISVVLPFHKNLLLLNRSLQSIEKQEFMPEEVFVIDNSAEGILDEFSYSGSIKLQSILKIISVRRRQSGALARNIGIKKAKKGNLIALLDSGDIWHPTHLRNAHNAIAKNRDEERLIYYPSYINWDIVDGKYLIRHSHKIENRNDILKLCPLGTSSVVIKSNINIKFPSYRLRHDLALWVELIDAGFKLIHSSDINMVRVIEEDSLSRNIFAKVYFQFKVYGDAVGYRLPLIFSFLYSQAKFKAKNIFKWKSSIDDIFTKYGFIDRGVTPSKYNSKLQLAAIAKIAEQMEGDPALKIFNKVEKLIVGTLLALQDSSISAEFFNRDEIKSHRFCSALTDKEFLTAIENLDEKNVLAVLPGVKKKEYRLRHGAKVLG
jgi:glycosyltransferase involved in cell wall biosynthesis